MTMTHRPLVAALALLLATTGCGSKAQRAADAMAQGVQLNAAGQYRAAALMFDEAVRLRDDIPALWIARARNQVQMNDYSGAFSSYSNALDQDRTNREALDAVGQLSLATNDMDKADDYAGQILALDPSDINAQLIRATVYFRRGKIDDAAGVVARILQQSPTNEPALVLKSRILQRRGDDGAAIAAIRPIFDSGRGSVDLRRQLVSIYERDADADGLARVAERDARDRRQDPVSQLAFVRQSFLIGRPQPAAAGLNALHRVAATDATRDATVAMLVDADVALADLARMLATLATVEPSLTVATAQYALATGDPAFALARVQPLVAARPLTAATTDLHAAYALALARLGRVQDAAPRAAAILAIDPDEPVALAARTLVEIATKDLDGALRDARVVVRDDPQSADGAALLAQVYRARGDAAAALRVVIDGFNDNVEDAGFLKLYVTTLAANGRRDDAASAARSFTIRHPASVLAWRLRQMLALAAKDRPAATRAAAILDRLHGKPVAMPAAPPEEDVAEKDQRTDPSR